MSCKKDKIQVKTEDQTNSESIEKSQLLEKFVAQIPGLQSQNEAINGIQTERQSEVQPEIQSEIQPNIEIQNDIDESINQTIPQVTSTPKIYSPTDTINTMSLPNSLGNR